MPIESESEEIPSVLTGTLVSHNDMSLVAQSIRRRPDEWSRVWVIKVAGERSLLERDGELAEEQEREIVKVCEHIQPMNGRFNCWAATPSIEIYPSLLIVRQRGGRDV